MQNFSINYGKHLNWREIGLRMTKNKVFDSSFIEFNFWKWFFTISYESKENRIQNRM